MSARLTPYDNGTRLEPHVWVRGDVATPGGLPRRTEEDDYGRVDLDDDEGRTVLTLYVERTAEGYTLHVENLTDSLRIEVDHEDHDEHTRSLLFEMGQRLGLIRTGSSDYHGLGKVGHELGCNTTRESAYRELVARIRRRGGRA